MSNAAQAPETYGIRVVPLAQSQSRRAFYNRVSLHSHTYHSREYLDFIPRVLGRAPAFDRLRQWLEQRHHRGPKDSVRYDAASWRPPLHPRAAYDLEAGQIHSLGLSPLVALTDHDDLEACADLCNLE